jgi:ADP-heptose:LPS heptosyltransferase
MIDIQLIDNKPQLFLREEENQWARAFLSEFSMPVGINPTSRSSKNQEWPIENWERLVSELNEINFIQLGSSDEPHLKGTIDLRGKTSIRESIALINNMNGYVGVDSFLGHVTGAVSTPSVILFGPSHPQVWGHPKNVNLYFKTHCSPCIDDIQDIPCPYSKECMVNITVEEVKDALLKQVFKASMEMENLTRDLNPI